MQVLLGKAPAGIVTGAPGAGKTAIIRQLELDGFSVVEEAATDVIAAYAVRTRDLNPGGIPSFIDVIADLQRDRQIRASYQRMSSFHDGGLCRRGDWQSTSGTCFTVFSPANWARPDVMQLMHSESCSFAVSAFPLPARRVHPLSRTTRPVCGTRYVGFGAESSDPELLEKLVGIADRNCIMMNTLRATLDVTADRSQ